MKPHAIIFSPDLSNQSQFDWVKKFEVYTDTNEFYINVEKQIKSGTCAFIIVTDKNLQAWPENLFDAPISEAKVILTLIYTDSDTDAQLKFVKKNPYINHLVSIESHSVSNDIHQMCNLYSAAHANGTSPEASLNLLTNLKLNNPIQVELSKTKDRWKAYEDLGVYAEKLECFSDFVEIAKTVASELVTNAFFDGKRHHKSGKEFHSNRTLDFELDPNEKIELCYGIESEDAETEYLWIIAKDPFGSLNRKTVVDSMHRAATERRPRVDTPGGAGLGLIMLYEWCSAMHFILQEGTSSSVACKLRITRRNRVFESEQNSLHICITESV